MARTKIGLGMSTVAKPTNNPAATDAMGATNHCGNLQACSACTARANDDRWLFIQFAKRLMALLCPIVTILGSRQFMHVTQIAGKARSQARQIARLLHSRSEEHTSELQSRGHLVFRLL